MEQIKETWTMMTKRADFNGISARFGISPIIARLVRNRDQITDDQIRVYLYGTLQDIPAPGLLKDVQKAAEIIREKIRQKKKIRIISDYDVDGVSSNYILMKGLIRCGAQVDYKIPDRIQDGYGINIHLVRQAYEDQVDTIITCDNGISAMEQVEYGNSLGMTTIITDHHDVPFQMEGGRKKELLPPAAAIVNPKQKDCPYPFKKICGAVVAWKFIQVLYETCGIDPAETEEFLEIAALATNCDVMPLVEENRIIVREGLRRMADTKITGLRALIEANKLDGRPLSVYHLGFILGPCINSSGRLSSAKYALDLLLSQDEARCARLASHLVSLNAERKDITEKGVRDGIAYLLENGYDKDDIHVVYLPGLHESLCGIVAGRIRERFHHPAFVLSDGLEGIKGSGRSIDTYSMYEEMSKIKECFASFGGHPGAAGFTLKDRCLEEFREKINEHSTLTEEDFAVKVKGDMLLPLSQVSEQLLGELHLLEPFGLGNSRPLFLARDLKIRSFRILGKNRNVVKLFVTDSSGYGMTAMYFDGPDLFLDKLEQGIGEDQAKALQQGLRHNVFLSRAAFQVDMNEYMGRREAQMILKHFEFREAKRN